MYHLSQALTITERASTLLRMGRKRINGEDEAVLARFPSGTVERIDALRQPAESRAGFVREAVQREVKRREKMKTNKDPPCQMP